MEYALQRGDIALDTVLEALNAGGVIVYPTETLYAVGCRATDEAACRRVVAIKARPDGKPLPLIIGWPEGLELVTEFVSEPVRRLAKIFWPGPLSILVKAREGLPSLLSDSQGYTSVRLSPHPVAAELSRKIQAPLVATSANRSGMPAAARPDELDSALLSRVDDAMLEKPWPQGGEPSTVIRIRENKELEVIRTGAVRPEELQRHGFEITRN